MQYNMQSLVYRKGNLNAHQLLKEIKCVIDSLPEWKEKADNWVIAHPTKKIIAFTRLGVSDEALDYVKYLIDNGKGIYIVLADEKEDDSIITILYKNTPAVSSERYILSVIVKSLCVNKGCDDFIEMFNKLIKYDGWQFKYIALDTEQYRFNQRNLFNDRLSVGWMLYLPVAIERKVIPSAYAIYNVNNPTGSFIVSKDIFNGEEPVDVAYANNVEIELAANGFLPLIKGL